MNANIRSVGYDQEVHIMYGEHGVIAVYDNREAAEAHLAALPEASQSHVETRPVLRTYEQFLDLMRRDEDE